ncbi:aminomethyl-transferring glycine dehydrogenase subunit GcvPA [Treponema sp. TIM-1]|uniref:aminomethyl-transferring glycine dehydrogenase subunit GcvPA n=1 Tax=Treponema sp. TIM-1 TaxID=2898417 RepID=UPI0039807F41
MPYIPVTEAQRKEMLERIGVPSLEALFSEIPEDLRFPSLDLEGGLSELEVMAELSALAHTNAAADDYRWFLGAGAYDHFIPAAVGALASRGEFLTAYTPYQSEVSQGTLQAIFEYQSMIAALTGMEVVNAGHYDGATALAEGVLLALRNPEGRRRVLLPTGLHPEYRGVLDTYLSPFDARIETYSGDPANAAQGEDPACLVAAYPDFFGRIPSLEGAAGAVHDRGGLFIVHADPIMLGLLKSPGAYGADIVTAEGQSLGNDLNYGGPFLGIMAVSAALMRRIPGRIVGEARDSQGRRGFVLTLAAREQHIRREKALSNICSNQGLCALRACIYLALLGKQGLRGVAELCWHKSHYAAGLFAALPGFSLGPGPFFKEFLVTLPGNAETAAEKLREKKIVAGLPLSRYFPEREKDLLVCVTEKNSREDIETLVHALKELYL